MRIYALVTFDLAAWLPTPCAGWSYYHTLLMATLLPLYLDPEREALLAELRLPCTGTESQWLQAGAALFLSSDA